MQPIKTIGRLIQFALGVVLWLPWMVVEAVLLLVGLVVVPVTFPNLPRLYMTQKGRPHTIWEAAVRNPVGGLAWWFKHPPEEDVFTWGTEEPEPTAHKKWFVWRIRMYKWMVSLRLVWRYTPDYYGELYLGWKLNSEPPMLGFGMSPRVIPRKVGQ